MDNIRVGQIRIDPSDGERIRIISNTEYEVIRVSYGKSYRLGARFIIFSHTLDTFSQVDETWNVTQILKRYEGRR